MPGFIGAKEGTLVLFPSKALMYQVAKTLKRTHPGSVLCQNDMGVKELVKTHKARIESGKGSILCGVATLAEGLDLPGDLCTHVIICALPFTVPNSPVELELQEVLGKDYFSKRALPDTLTRLIQMTGRLMRRETDRGRITVFDKRLHTTRWGRKLLDAMPDFKRTTISPARPPVFNINLSLYPGANQLSVAMLHKEFWGLLFLAFVAWMLIATTPSQRIEKACAPVGWSGSVVTSLSALVLPNQQATLQGWFDKLEYGCQYTAWRLFYQDEYNAWLKSTQQPADASVAPAQNDSSPTPSQTP